MGDETDGRDRLCGVHIADFGYAGSMTSRMPGTASGSELLGMLRPYVRHCGDERRSAWLLRRRRILDHLVVSIADGQGRFQVGTATWLVQPGDVVWIPPDTDHEMEGFAPGMTCPYLHGDLLYRPAVSHWDFSIPGGTTDLSAFAPLMHPPLTHPDLLGLAGLHRGPAARRTGDLIREICREAARGLPYATLRISALFLDVITELLRGRGVVGSIGDTHAPLLEDAAARLRRLGERAQISDLADAAGLSPSRFRELFARQFGLSPRAYGKAARIRRAKELLVASPLSISEVARRVGFADVHAFSKAFRISTGVPPRDYRRCGPEAAIRVEGRQAPYAH
jgi:AraC-like DNA-binding protein